MTTITEICCLFFGLILLQGGYGRVLDFRGQTDDRNSLVVRTRREGRCGKDITIDHKETFWIALQTTEINGTEFYDQNSECHWTVSAPQGYYVMLESEYFALELSDDCMWDYVEIDEGDGGKKFCGWDRVVYISDSNYVTIRFKSDESYEDRGFRFTVKIIAKASIPPVSRCNSSIREGPAGTIANQEDAGVDCFYRIQAPIGKVVELNLKKDITFGSNTCEQESILVYKGYTIQGEHIQLCSDSVQQVIQFRNNVLFVHYSNVVNSEGERFEIEYSFVEDNFPVATTASTTPSPVGGDNDCSRFIKDESDEFIYTTPEYQNNKECIVVVRNTQLPDHVIQIEFTKFELEESDDCMFDYFKVLSGERNDSAPLGGPYCGTSLNGRTFVTNGNSLRLEFKTDVSLALFGVEAKISFVPVHACDHCERRTVCIQHGYEKECLRGTKCPMKCQNGGTCVSAQSSSDQLCYCPTGFSGDDCSHDENQGTLIFTTAPQSSNLKRGSSHIEQCQVSSTDGDANIKYDWTFKGSVIGEYNSKTGFGTHAGGVLQIDSFTDELEGQYSCFATSGTSIAEHTFEYKIVEDCNIRIYPGPQAESKKVGQTALLMCHSPDAKEIRWKKDGILIDFRRDTRFMQLVNGYLSIRAVMKEDEGTYRCEAQSNTGCYSYREGKLSIIDVKQHNTYCGKSIYDIAELAHARISKGEDARPKANPWHVTIRSNFNDGVTRNSVFCGGSLITANYVLTAAHCVKQFVEHFGGKQWSKNNVQLILGTTDCLGNDQSSTVRSPKTTTVHPDFERLDYMDSDIALLELDSPVEYTDSIRPICIEPLIYNERAFFEGRGSLQVTTSKAVGCGKMTGGSAKVLQQLFLPYVPRETCEESLEDTEYKLTETMICAGKKVARTGDTCGGDSGGSLVMSTDDRWIQTGIISWGMGCDRNKFYGMYTNVGFFYDWIKEITHFDEEEVPKFLRK